MLIKKNRTARALGWCMPTVPTLGRLRQDDQDGSLSKISEFEAVLGYMRADLRKRRYIATVKGCFCISLVCGCLDTQ